MKKTKIWTISLAACICFLAVCLMGLFMINFHDKANAAVKQDEEYPKAEISFPPFYMKVGEEVSFTAVYTYMGLWGNGEEREIYDYDFTWEVTEGDALTVTDYGLVRAVAVGEATLTATYIPDPTYAPSVTVEVLEAGTIEASSLYLDASNLSLDIGAEYDLHAVVVPFNATDKTVIWATDDSTIAIVENGKVTAVAAGTTTITAYLVLSDESILRARCEVEVRELDNSILDKTSLTLYLGKNLGEEYPISGNITATIADAPAGTVFHWASLNDSVATPDFFEDNIGTISAWNFGSTIITVTITVPAEEEGEEPTVYVASANVLVTANYFYAMGFEGRWLEQSQTEALQAGYSFTEVEHGIYQLTRSIWQNAGFQIIYGGINVYWTTKLTPECYDAGNSTDNYVDNTTNMFRVTADGVYTIVIDLTGSAAKVSINLISEKLTVIELSIAEGYESYLEEGGDTYVDVAFLPVGALYNVARMTYTVEGNDEDIVDITYDEEARQFYVLRLGDPIEVTNITITAMLDDSYGSIVIAVIPAEFEAPTEVRFDAESYSLNLNNQGAPWSTSVKAMGYKEGAANVVSDVVYSVPEVQRSRLYVKPATGEVDVYGLGTFTIRATSVVDPEIYAETTLTVYSSGFYMIGILQGTRVNDWNLLPQDQTTLEGTDFEPWEIPAVDGSLTKYQADFTLDREDCFSIAFLGMAGDWYASINTAYFNAAESSESYFITKGRDVVIAAREVYTVTLDLSGIQPAFMLTYKEPAEGFTAHNQYLYLEKAGNAWDRFETDEGNIYTTAGYVYVDGENTTSLTFSFTFTTENTVWPTFQFVTANGITGGTFYVSYWYGRGAASEVDVKVFGDAISETGETGYFYNGGSGYEYFYVGDAIPDEGIILNFTVNFNELGLITSIVINFGEIAG